MQITDPEKIGKFISAHQKEARALEEQIMEIMWYMRGSISREEAWMLSNNERNIVLKLIKNNVERVNKTGLPLL